MNRFYAALALSAVLVGSASAQNSAPTPPAIAYGVAGTPSAKVGSIQGVAGGTPVPMTSPTEGATTDTCALYTATCGIDGRLSDLERQMALLLAASSAAEPCAVTTAAPSYTTGTTQPTSCDPTGHFRVNASDYTQPVSAVRQATASLPINVSATATTQLVPLSGSTAIYISALDFEVTGTDTVTFEYGTGTACAGGTTALTGPYSFTAGSGISKGTGIAPILFIPAGNAFCILHTGTTQVSGSFSYTQF